MTSAAIATESRPEPTWRPIIMSGDRIDHTLAGTKSQTRRIVTEQPEAAELDLSTFFVNDSRPLWRWKDLTAETEEDLLRQMATRSPYGRVGDRLWIKETFAVLHFSVDPETGVADDWAESRAIPKDARDGYWTPVHMQANAWVRDLGADRDWRWRSPIHMPRWASRIALEITDVRAQRLHDISESDAEAEGIEPFFVRYPQIGRDQVIIWKRSTRWSGSLRGDEPEYARDFPYRASFATIWDEINGDRTLWNMNPVVWAITFRRIENRTP